MLVGGYKSTAKLYVPLSTWYFLAVLSNGVVSFDLSLGAFETKNGVYYHPFLNLHFSHKAVAAAAPFSRYVCLNLNWLTHDAVGTQKPNLWSERIRRLPYYSRAFWKRAHHDCSCILL